MKTVKNLMIGKETALLVMVSKAFMKRLVYRCKTDGVALQLFAFKDILQALLLLLAICQYIQGVTLEQEILQSVTKQIEILMEKRLRSDIERYHSRTL